MTMFLLHLPRTEWECFVPCPSPPQPPPLVGLGSITGNQWFTNNTSANYHRIIRHGCQTQQGEKEVGPWPREYWAPYLLHKTTTPPILVDVWAHFLSTIPFRFQWNQLMGEEKVKWSEPFTSHPPPPFPISLVRFFDVFAFTASELTLIPSGHNREGGAVRKSISICAN